MIDYLIDQGKEPSTWRGLCLFLAAGGVVLEPEQTEAIVAFGLGLSGFIGMVTRDRPKR